MKKYDIAAYIWPSYTGDEPRSRIFWPEGYGEWETVKNSKSKCDRHVWPRKPLWGYVNEADPFVMEMEIEAAAAHGVNVFIYDWYWYDNRPFLEQCLDNGYLKARNNDKVKFYIMWANHPCSMLWDRRQAGLDVKVWDAITDFEVFKTIADRMVNMYFTHPSYYKIDGKPVFMIYLIHKFIQDLGGVENAKKAMEYMNNAAIKAGLPGIHWQAHYLNSFKKARPDANFDGTTIDILKYLGFDSSTIYQFAASVDMNRPYPDVLKDAKIIRDRFSSETDIPFFPHVSLGWDTNPRFPEFLDRITTDTTPENIKKAFVEVKKYVDNHPELPVPLITVNSWNEWTESSYLQPDDINGYGYLKALKEVFVDGIEE